MSGAYRANPEKDPNGDDLPPVVAAPSGHFKGALITHNGDIYVGDGLQDLIVRVEGKLPDGAPSQASLTLPPHK